MALPQPPSLRQHWRENDEGLSAADIAQILREIGVARPDLFRRLKKAIDRLQEERRHEMQRVVEPDISALLNTARIEQPKASSERDSTDNVSLVLNTAFHEGFQTKPPKLSLPVSNSFSVLDMGFIEESSKPRVSLDSAGMSVSSLGSSSKSCSNWVKCAKCDRKIESHTRIMPCGDMAFCTACARSIVYDAGTCPKCHSSADWLEEDDDGVQEKR